MFADNPAERLSKFFQSAISAGSDPNMPTFQVWQKALGYSEEKDTLRGMLILQNTVAELVRIVETCQDENEKALFARCVFPIRGIFSFGMFNNPWNSTKNNLTSEVLYGLPFLSISLDRSGNEPKIEQTTIERWIQELESLSHEIAEDEKDRVLSSMLLRAIAELLFVLRNYSIYGHEALNNEFLRATGILSISGKKKNSHVAKLKNTVVAIGFSLTLISSASQISGYSIKNIIADNNKREAIYDIMDAPKQIENNSSEQ